MLKYNQKRKIIKLSILYFQKIKFKFINKTFSIKYPWFFNKDFDITISKQPFNYISFKHIKAIASQQNSSALLMQQKLKQAQKQVKSWQQKYNTLLQKNQNDLIKIRLRQKQLNETIGKLEKQKQELQITMGKKIKDLQQQIQLLKSQTQIPNKTTLKTLAEIKLQQRLQTQLKKTDEVKKEILEYKQKNKVLQKQLEKTLKENIALKANKQSKSGNQQTQISLNLNKQKENSKRIQETLNLRQQRIKELQKLNQTLQVQLKQAKSSLSKFEQQKQSSTHSTLLKQLSHKKQSQGLHSQVERLRELLTLSNIQYKNLTHKEQLKQQLLLSKNEQLNMMTQQLKKLQQKNNSLKQNQIYRIKNQQLQNRLSQLEQENLLVKQMIKSHKTIIKVKENQIEKLKQKIEEISRKK